MSNSFEFKPFTAENLSNLTSIRNGEKKLGECITTTINSATKYAIIGVCEDIGPQSNQGNPGSNKGFNSFLTKFLNMQSNRYLNGKEIAILGIVEQNNPFDNLSNGRIKIEELDNLLISILTPLFKQNITPIIIGGGHNNAYPLINSFSVAKNKKLDVINLDPHADCRALEGRHSGNPFSYAITNNFLNHYCVLGLHKAYNSEFIYEFLDKHQCTYTFFEDYIINPKQFEVDIQSIIIRSDEPIGIELDMDSIAYMPTSAYSPSGISIEIARKYICKLASSKRPTAYLHLPEAAPNDLFDEKITGKSLAYLVYDFIQVNR